MAPSKGIMEDKDNPAPVFSGETKDWPAFKDAIEDKDIATGLQLSLNKNRLRSLGSNFTDYKKLGFKDDAALEKAHKSIDLNYLLQLNRMVARLLHDAVFEPSTNVTPAQNKLNENLRNSEVSQILRGAVNLNICMHTTTRNGLLNSGRSLLCRSGPRCTTSTRA